MTAKDLLDHVWDNLQGQIASVQKQVNRQSVKTESALYADSVPAFTFANLPGQGLADGSTYISLAWCSNGRRPGQGAGAGTGTLVFWDQGTAAWRNIHDYTAVTI